MSIARSFPRWAPAALAAAVALSGLGCATESDLAQQIEKNLQRSRDLDQRLEALSLRVETLGSRLSDLQLAMTEANTRLGQISVDMEQIRQHSPALSHFENAQEKQAKLAELLTRVTTVDDAAWIDVKEGLIRLGAIAVSPLLQRYAAGDALALRRVPQVLRGLIDPDAVTELAAGLESPRTRALAAEAMGLLGNPDGAAWLRGHLTDESAEVRHAVAVALGRLKDLSGMPVLIGELEQADLDTRMIAIRELEQLAGQDFGYSAYEKDETKRGEAVARARAWFEAQRATAPGGGGPGTEGPGADKPADGAKGAER